MGIGSVDNGELTKDTVYTGRLMNLYDKSWKRKLRFVDPYRWNVRRLCRGRVLEVGCGIGRNLESLGNRSVGVDHNPDSIQQARNRGFEAYTSEEFLKLENTSSKKFDTILLAHVLEHISEDVQDEILQTYLPYLRKGGKVVLICPQEKGYASDSTHIRWVDQEIMAECLSKADCTSISKRSFPFPRFMGKLFIYNEFIVTGVRG